jgi:hypothetical protein
LRGAEIALILYLPREREPLTMIVCINFLNLLCVGKKRFSVLILLKKFFSLMTRSVKFHLFNDGHKTIRFHALPNYGKVNEVIEVDCPCNDGLHGHFFMCMQIVIMLVLASTLWSMGLL